MDKVAQRRGFTHKVREKLSPSQLLERFDGSFKEFMDNLRKLDDEIRVSTVENKKLLDTAKLQFKSKDYLLCFAHLISFFEKNQEMVLKLQDLNQQINLDHIKLLEKDISDEELKLLQEKIDNLKFSHAKNLLQKNAGIFDLFNIDIKDLFRSRYWISELLEDRFSTKDFINFTKGLKNILIDATKLSNVLKDNLKPMSLARAQRNPKEYYTFANNYIKEFQNFRGLFSKFYSSSASKILNDINQIKKQKEDERQNEERERIERIQGPFAKIKPLTEEDLKTNKPEEKSVDIPSESRKTLQKLKNDNEQIPFDLVSKIDEKVAKNEFIKIIKNAAKEDNINLMLNEILKFSNVAENFDVGLSNNLISIANNIVKQADPEDEWINRLPEKLPGIPEKKEELPVGHIDEPYRNVDFLKDLGPDKITSSATATLHCFDLFTKRLTSRMPNFTKSKQLGSNFLPVLKNNIVKSLVVMAEKPQDSHNPNDRLVMFLTKINLSELDPKLDGNAVLYVQCRYSFEKKNLSLKTIQKNFRVS
jgi:hypothetical protein